MLPSSPTPEPHAIRSTRFSLPRCRRSRTTIKKPNNAQRDCRSGRHGLLLLADLNPFMDSDVVEMENPRQSATISADLGM